MMKGVDECMQENVGQTIPRKVLLTVDTSFHEEGNRLDGPDDEFLVEARDEVNDTLINKHDHDDERVRIDHPIRDNGRECLREEVDVIQQRESGLDKQPVLSEKTIQKLNSDNVEDDDDNRSNVSDLTTPDEETGTATRTTLLPRKSKNVALFDGALLDAEEDTEDEVTTHKRLDNSEPNTNDDHTVESKSVVDESTKNVDKAEALAKEMQRILAENLAGFQESTPTPSMDEPREDTTTKDAPQPSTTSVTGHLEPSPSPEMMISPQNASSFYYSKQKILKLATITSPSVSTVEGSKKLWTSSSHSTSTSDGSSLPGLHAVPLRRQRPTVRYRQAESSSSSNVHLSSNSSNRGPKSLQVLLESVVFPALLLISTTVVCQCIFNPWLKAGNRVWTVTSTVLCIGGLAAPIFAFEYMLLGGYLAKTPIPKALKDYPEVKKFLRDIRRLRLRGGWWYASEVRSLRKDLEATNAELLRTQLENLRKGGDKDDEKSLERQLSREQQHRERAQLEKLFDNERADWLTEKEDLLLQAMAGKENNSKLQAQLEKEKENNMKLKVLNENLESDTNKERACWNTTRERLEEALKTAMESVESETKSTIIFAEMEKERIEEREKWEAEKEKLKRTMEEAGKTALRRQQEQEDKYKELDNIRAEKEVALESQCKSLEKELQAATERTKAMKDDLECQICQLNDILDYERAEVKTIRAEYVSNIETLETKLTKTESERDDYCQQLKQSQKEFDEERAQWDSKMKAFETAPTNNEKSTDREVDDSPGDDAASTNTSFVGNETVKSSVRERRRVEVSLHGIDSENITSTVEDLSQRNDHSRLLRCFLREHVRSQSATRHVGQLLASSRAMLEACELSTDHPNSAELFGRYLMQYTAASVSAKRYMDEFVLKTGHEMVFEIEEMPSFGGAHNVVDGSTFDMNEESIRSNRSTVALTPNSWLRNAPLWENLWTAISMARTNPFHICQVAVHRLYSGILFGSSVRSSTNTSSPWNVSSKFQNNAEDEIKC